MASSHHDFRSNFPLPKKFRNSVNSVQTFPCLNLAIGSCFPVFLRTYFLFSAIFFTKLVVDFPGTRCTISIRAPHAFSAAPSSGFNDSAV